jgi:hypothetical protein
VECCEAVLDLGRAEGAHGVDVPLPLAAGLGAKHPQTRLTPAHNAAYNDNRAVLALLVNRGAPVNEGVVSGDTPLMLACQEGHGEVVATLVGAGAEINRRLTQGATAFHFACCGGTAAHADVAAFLVQQGATAGCQQKCLKCKLLLAQARRRLARQAEVQEARRREEQRAEAAEAAERRVAQDVEEGCPSLFMSFADFAAELRGTEREAEEEATRQREAKEAKQSAAAADKAQGGAGGGGKKKKGGAGKKKKKK